MAIVPIVAQWSGRSKYPTYNTITTTPLFTNVTAIDGNISL